MTSKTNKELLTETLGELKSFKEQYDTDMRGDKDLTNGNKGVINEIRTIKSDMADMKSSVEENQKDIRDLQNSDNRWKVIAVILGGGGIAGIISLFGG